MSSRTVVLVAQVFAVIISAVVLVLCAAVAGALLMTSALLL